ncbi:DUF3306 domain-containing protein [Massilia sp. CFBP9012]|uniref:DUF3306 domain-containing protein n=1 Tax=Massilia sp. CFBP9012 TaxID=3096531 RepID=UPI002A6ADCD0|nr:DUF3306 domain-containing protein [Massilia sp. CFBP9012]MDY0973746.1 DUF3306 domain-containing protein [Massilia sp. CFBP9012]
MSADVIAEEGFLRRWARMKSSPEPVEEALAAEAPVTAVQPPPVEEARPLPTLDDVARLTPESDYSAFVAKGVDKAVQRMALKKLFADPNFAVMDGLDIYISDYNKAAPLTDAMLAALKHAPGVLDRLLAKDEDEDEGDPAAEGEPCTPTQGTT